MYRLTALFSIAAFSYAAVDRQTLEHLCTEELTRTAIPGIAVAVIEGGGVAFAKGFGVASIEAVAPVTADHLFRIGSTTKAFVATAVLRLAEQRKLNLDDPVGKYIHGLPPGIARATIEQALTHRAGLIEWGESFGPHDDEALARTIAAWTPETQFTNAGEIVSYTNLSYLLAGRVIEVVAAKPFADAMEELVFKPLGMERTTFRPTLAMTYPLAQGHVAREGNTVIVGRPAADHAGYWPGGSIFTSANEFVRFAVALLNKGVVRGKQSISADVIAKLTTRREPYPSATGTEYYGYGLATSLSSQTPILAHGGFRNGYTSEMLLAPERGIGVIVLGNRSGGDVGTLARRLFESALGESMKEAEVKPQPAALPLRAYQGVFTNRDQVLEVQAADSGMLVIKTPEGPRTVTHLAHGCFVSEKEVSFCFAGGGAKPKYLHTGLVAFRRKE
ncbi:MAG: serine hydrolase domain-containing protein [Bryobacteraceae bacterium]